MTFLVYDTVSFNMLHQPVNDHDIIPNGTHYMAQTRILNAQKDTCTHIEQCKHDMSFHKKSLIQGLRFKSSLLSIELTMRWEITIYTELLKKPDTFYLLQSDKVAKIRNRYNQVPHLTQDTNGKVTNSQKTPQTRAKRSALSQQVTTKHI